MYDLNEEISIPNATLCVDGENKVANAIVITPSGAHKSSSVIKLSEEGRYTIRYAPVFKLSFVHLLLLRLFCSAKFLSIAAARAIMYVAMR